MSITAPAAARRSRPELLARGPFGPVSYDDTPQTSTARPGTSLEAMEAMEDQRDAAEMARMRALHRDEITDQLKALFPDERVIYYEKLYTRDGWVTSTGDLLEVRRYYRPLGIVVDAVTLPVRLQVMDRDARQRALEREILHRRGLVEPLGWAYVALRSGWLWDPAGFRIMVTEAVNRVVPAEAPGGT